MKTVTLGGDRLGSGKKQKVELNGFERSTHDLGYVWRNTQAPGTLVPFMVQLALPGDTFDINLGADVKTHPTLGPLFGSFKLQLDVFECPIRLYHSWLHNNKLNVGMNISSVKLPTLYMNSNPISWIPTDGVFDYYPDPSSQQINPSCILAYLGIRGLGDAPWGTVRRAFNGVPFLAFWDIYKNYYANKHEEIGMVIHSQDLNVSVLSPVTITGDASYSGDPYNMNLEVSQGDVLTLTYLVNQTNPITGLPNNTPVVNYKYGQYILVPQDYTHEPQPWSIIVKSFTVQGSLWRIVSDITIQQNGYLTGIGYTEDYFRNQISKIQITTFQLSNIDEMRDLILANNNSSPFDIIGTGLAPYNLPFVDSLSEWSTGQKCMISSQEGLPLKTYQSDIYNNWLNTEWIDGSGGINEITAISTSAGSFDLNTLNLAQKVYDMLNRIAVSGGSYEDWLEAVYDHTPYRKCETPMYHGGLSKEVIFQEVVSTAATDIDPLGRLAGRGGMAPKHKGGQVNIKVMEPSYLIGIVSITPRIDYSQGNEFFTNHKTLDDLHKPSLDQIGFQDLVTDKLAFWDTALSNGEPVFKSAGKQPAWIDYMSNVNKLYGNFAIEDNEMFMTLCRNYSPDAEHKEIKDLTTYIDPTKFNYAFAQTDLSAMNFWVQIGVDITARRKISSKLMPNL